MNVQFDFAEQFAGGDWVMKHLPEGSDADPLFGWPAHVASACEPAMRDGVSLARQHLSAQPNVQPILLQGFGDYSLFREPY